ncbi:MAG TPA: PTS fructose transporter subunit IIA, partial [Alteromonas macleodii]|nr:PTS fructose transporter subunit IIA [Alteromonas macleodii]
MDIQAIVSLDRTECAVQCNSKKRILEIIADIAAKQNENIDQATVL